MRRGNAGGAPVSSRSRLHGAGPREGGCPGLTVRGLCFSPAVSLCLSPRWGGTWHLAPAGLRGDKRRDAWRSASGQEVTAPRPPSPGLSPLPAAYGPSPASPRAPGEFFSLQQSLRLNPVRHLRGMLSAECLFLFTFSQLLQSQPLRTVHPPLHPEHCSSQKDMPEQPTDPIVQGGKLRPRRRNRNGAPAQPCPRSRWKEGARHMSLLSLPQPLPPPPGAVFKS